MADTYTGTGAVLVDQAAYDRSVYHDLRRNLYFDNVADVKATKQAMPGSTVVFNITSDLSLATSTLNESTDVDAVAVSDANVTVTLVEKGNAVIVTAKLRGVSYVVPYSSVVSDLLAFNAAASLDAIAGAELVGGTNVRYATVASTDPDARNKIEPEDIIGATNVRRLRTDLAAANSMPFNSGMYAAFIHPDVAFDLRAETGAAAWRDPHTYSQPGEIWSGEIGAFEGLKFVETASPTLVLADAGSSTTLTDVYITVAVGRQSLAKAYSETDGNGAYPQVVLGPVTDKLRRNVPIGWYWLGGFKRFREASIRRFESSSSIGTNA